MPASARLAFPRVLSFVLVVALAALSAGARAAADDNTLRAKELFQQGTTLFNLGEFDKAIEAWQEGYKAKPDPGFLYNIGQAYRLKGDSQKAIFFYRGYLRNSPNAKNRAEIEAKIAALQKEASEAKPPTPAPSTPPPVTTAAPPPPPPAPPPAHVPPPPPHVTPPPPVAPAPPPPVAPTPLAPPPIVTPPLPGTGGELPPEVPAPLPEAPVAAAANRPLDMSLGLGFATWTSGLNIKGSAPAQFALDLGAGYTFGSDVFGGFSFRLGLLFGRTTLDEGSGATKNTITFTSFLVEPSVRVRLVDHRLYLTGAVGLGGQSIGGVRPTSVVLDPKYVLQGVKVNGSLGAFESRVAIGLQFHIVPALFVFASPAVSNSPKPQYFYQALGRFEMMFGAGLYL
jgi:hypothetical protein